MCIVSFLDAIDLMFVQGEGGSDMPATLDSDDVFRSAGSTSATPLTSSVDSGKVKYESVSKTPSWASTPKSRSMSSGKTSQSNLEKYGQISPNFPNFPKFFRFAYLLNLLKFGRSSLKFPQIWVYFLIYRKYPNLSLKFCNVFYNFPIFSQFSQYFPNFPQFFETFQTFDTTVYTSTVSIFIQFNPSQIVINQQQLSFQWCNNSHV
jgi:hypothetical protein